MSILSDIAIKHLVEKNKIIEPFFSRQVSKDEEGNKVLSYGLSSYGYDARCANDFQIFDSGSDVTIDPKNFQNAENTCTRYLGSECIIPANSFALTHTLEYFRIPRNVLALCVGKSTYARCGVIINTTPLEPEWEGHITVEISNTTPFPVRIYGGEGLLQILFHVGDQECVTSYADRKGKYQKQEGITLPRMS